MNDRSKAKVLAASTVLVLVLAAAYIISLPPLIHRLLNAYAGGLPAGYVTGYSIVFGLAAIPFVMVIISVGRIFINIARGVLYNRNNAEMFHRVTVWLGVQAAISFSGYLLSQVLFGSNISIAFFLMGLVSAAGMALSAAFRRSLLGAIHADDEGETI